LNCTDFTSLGIFSFDGIRFKGTTLLIPQESFENLYFLQETKHPPEPHVLWMPEAKCCHHAKQVGSSDTHTITESKHT
jgi:hypothetical protein